jgi:hypothetical protein
MVPRKPVADLTAAATPPPPGRLRALQFIQPQNLDIPASFHNDKCWEVRPLRRLCVGSSSQHHIQKTTWCESDQWRFGR